jgi:hypothetical protein
MAVVQMTDWAKNTDTLDEVIEDTGASSRDWLTPEPWETNDPIDLDPPHPIPEFSDLLIPVAGVFFIVVLVIRKRRSRKPKD